MSKIVKIVSTIAINPIIVFGFYIIAHGHLTPGGGFQGGVIIASVIVLILISFEEKISEKIFFFFESLGLASFILLAFLGLSKNTFFYNFLANTYGILGQTIKFGSNPGYLNSGGVIPLMNLAVGIEVLSALSLVAILIIRNKTKI